MKKSIKFIIVFLILILLCFVGIISYYKFFEYEEEEEEIEEQYSFKEKLEISNDISYTTEYANNIINDLITSVNYFVSVGDKAIYGKLFISEEKKLYILNEQNNSYKQLIDDKRFKTLKNVGTEDASGLLVYAISNDGKLYLINLSSTNFDDIKVKEIELGVFVDKFTTLKFKSYLDIDNMAEIILTNDGKMIDANSGLLYSDKILNVFNQFLVYEDNTIFNNKGNILKDASDKIIKIKSIIVPEYEQNVFKFSPIVVLITTNNSIIYLENDNKIHDYGKIISDINYEDGKIYINFIDKTSINFRGIYSEI